ncbi:MAG: VanZ family protein [Luteitalea sp.]
MTSSPERFWPLACAASVTVIVMATTLPWSGFVGHPHWANIEWLPFSRRVRPLDVVLNVLLFVPFGWSALRVARGPVDAAPVVSAALLLSVSVELYQVYCHGRQPTTIDVITNTLGAWLGTRLPGRSPASPW